MICLKKVSSIFSATFKMTSATSITQPASRRRRSTRRQRVDASQRASEPTTPAASAGGDEPIRRRRWLRYAVAGLLLAFAAWTIARGIRISELRSRAIRAAEARQAGQWQHLETVTRRWQEKDPRASMAWLLAAEAAQHQDSPGRMAAYLEQMPEDAAETPAALLELATAYFGPLNQPSRGEAACLKSLRLSAENNEAYRRLVFFYAMTLQRDRLVRFAREAIQTGNDSPETYIYLIGADWITLSNAAEYNGKWLQSGDDPERFIVGHLVHAAGSAGLESVAVNLAEDPGLRKRVASVLGITATDAASVSIDQGLQRFPQNPELIAYQLRLRAAEGEVERVAELLAEVPAAAATDNRFFHYRGWLHDALGETEAAIAAYREALRLNPFDWRSQLKLAVALRLVDQDEEAERFAELAIAGKELRETIMKLDDVQSIPMPVLDRMLDYCRHCDSSVAESLKRRIDMIRTMRTG